MEHERIRVLHLIKCLDRGGAEKLLATMLTTGDRDHYDYEVAFARTDMHDLAPDFTAGGTTVHDLGASSDFDLRWAIRLRQLLAAGAYDVLHSHLPYSAAVGRIVTRTLPPAQRPRLVYTEHSLHNRNNVLTRGLRRLTGGMDDVSIAVSETNRQALPTSLRDRTQVILHGVDLASVVVAPDRDATRASLGVEGDGRLVVCVANLTPQKGYPVLLEAASQLVTTGLPVTFVAAGSGPMADRLAATRDQLGLDKRFVFLGPRADAIALIAAADVLVLASNWECMPVVVMEAFAVATPVVATTTGDLPWVIRDGYNGLLVERGNAHALADALKRVLVDDNLRQQLATGAGASAWMFDARRATAEVEAIYARLVGR